MTYSKPKPHRADYTNYSTLNRTFWAVNKFVLVPTYDSTVKFYIEATVTDEDNPTLGLQAVNLAQRIANTYIELMKTNSFYNLLAGEMGTDLPVAELKEMIKYRSVQDTESLRLACAQPIPICL